MSKPKFGVFPSSNQSDRSQRELDLIAGTANPKTVAVPLGKIVPMLVDAVENDRVWLNDFADDTVQISCDLHEVLLAYQQLRSRVAA